MQIFYTFMNEYLVKNHIFMNECLAENYIFMNECLAENYTFMNVMGALAGLGIPIKEALRGFCNKIVTRLKHVSFPQKVDRQTASEASVTNSAVTCWHLCQSVTNVTHFRVRVWRCAQFH